MGPLVPREAQIEQKVFKGYFSKTLILVYLNNLSAIFDFGYLHSVYPWLSSIFKLGSKFDQKLKILGTLKILYGICTAIGLPVDKILAQSKVVYWSCCPQPPTPFSPLLPKK